MSVLRRARDHAARFPRPDTAGRQFEEWTGEERAAFNRYYAADGILYAIGSCRVSGEMAFALCDLPSWGELVERIVTDLDGYCPPGPVTRWLNCHYQELTGSCPYADAHTCARYTRERNARTAWPLPACPVHRPASRGRAGPHQSRPAELLSSILD